MRSCHIVIIALALGCGGAAAQQPAPPGMSPATAASKRFPQPVQVGALVGRRVLRPTESQPTLGFVAGVVRAADGQVSVILDVGGVLGIGTRRIAVPLEAMVLLGPYMEVVDLTPEQLAQRPTFDAAGTSPLPGDAVIKVGLARPSH